MKLDINVKIELGDKTINFINSILPYNFNLAFLQNKDNIHSKDIPFLKLENNQKLERIISEMEELFNSGKSTAVKSVLLDFGAGRASELKVEDYDAVFKALITLK